MLYSGAIGFSSDTNLVVLVFSIAAGGVIGEALDFDGNLNRFGAFLEKKLSSSEMALSFPLSLSVSVQWR